ncbi:hypothetical protein WAZ07_21560 [Bacillus sp. FJAT-51639]|uniref:HK97 gp10 family phage protein n=2 Tax=Bacillus TaxID=1386 RepID=A0ABU8FQ04_9BACI
MNGRKNSSSVMKKIVSKSVEILKEYEKPLKEYGLPLVRLGLKMAIQKKFRNKKNKSVVETIVDAGIDIASTNIPKPDEQKKRGGWTYKNEHWVRDYYKKDGTHVRGYFRGGKKDEL